MAKTIYVLNGPNLNALGTREPEKYGYSTLADVEKLCHDTAQRFGLTAEFRQSNHEGVLVDWVHEATQKQKVGIALNPAGYSHTSVAILDAISAVGTPAVEVHITNVTHRHAFRQPPHISQPAKRAL